MSKVWTMPAEWEPHARCWMGWPCHETLFGPNGLEPARAAFVEVASAIAQFEPLTMVVRPDLADMARARLGSIEGISILPMAQDDSWLRDTGPTFVRSSTGDLAGIDWRFNGWGEVYGDWQADAAMAAAILAHQGYDRLPAKLTTEGGAIHTDGHGTFLLCETSLLDPERNPGWSRADVERELTKLAGATDFCWLNAGLSDDETRGHIDNIACFTGPGRVLTLDPPTASATDQDVLADNLAHLQTFKTAAGHSFEIDLLPLPAPKKRHDGSLMTCSYINFYIANGGIILPRFDDSADGSAAAIINRHFPDHQCVVVDANPILQGGGGIHCITQQQPH